MKKIFLLSLLLFFVFTIGNNLQAQQVEKNYVVVEIGTGTWCTYCPGAAMGADDLVENGHKVAIIENHNGDSYANIYSNTRNSYYGITGYPTAFFNGLDPVVGGSHTQSMYASYVPKYNAAIAVMSDFTVDMSYTNNGLDYDVTINVDEPGDYAGTNLKVHLFITESHIAENWQGQTELNFVNRAMYPDQNGTAYAGDAETINISFTANAAWDLSQCELVAFVQDVSSKEILQADKVTLAVPEGVNNVELTDISEIPDVCFGVIQPGIKIHNHGADDVTSLSINYNINSGATTGTFEWTGDPIEFNSFGSITFDEMNVILEPTNTIDFEITQVNGVANEDTTTNSGTGSFLESPESVDNMVFLELHTDNWGEECTWTITDYSGSVLESGGPYGNNQTITESFEMPGADCYSFNIMDSYGDGGGAIYLRDTNDDILYYTNGGYGNGESQAYKTPGAGASVEEEALYEVNIFPNPVSDIIHIENAQDLVLDMYDVLGRKILHLDSVSKSENINVTSLNSGTYFIQLVNGDFLRNEKIIISRK